mmetsp:Transcript_15280/g.34862  ORF Transcript_15280/g.34862 Transcript_15280/m.34862 type:complete len:326 (+) Transcript_15280:838-1815(+)
MTTVTSVPAISRYRCISARAIAGVPLTAVAVSTTSISRSFSRTPTCMLRALLVAGGALSPPSISASLARAPVGAPQPSARTAILLLLSALIWPLACLSVLLLSLLPLRFFLLVPLFLLQLVPWFFSRFLLLLLSFPLPPLSFEFLLGLLLPLLLLFQPRFLTFPLKLLFPLQPELFLLPRRKFFLLTLLFQPFPLSLFFGIPSFPLQPLFLSLLFQLLLLLPILTQLLFLLSLLQLLLLLLLRLVTIQFLRCLLVAWLQLLCLLPGLCSLLLGALCYSLLLLQSVLTTFSFGPPLFSWIHLTIFATRGAHLLVHISNFSSFCTAV